MAQEEDANQMFVFSVNIFVEFDGPVDTDPQSEDMREVVESISTVIAGASAQGLLLSNATPISLLVEFVGCVPAAVPDETYTPGESEDDNG